MVLSIVVAGVPARKLAQSDTPSPPKSDDSKPWWMYVVVGACNQLHVSAYGLLVKAYLGVYRSTNPRALTLKQNNAQMDCFAMLQCACCCAKFSTALALRTC